MNRIIVRVNGMISANSERHINKVIKQEFNIKRVKSYRKKGETVIISDADIHPLKVKKVILDAGYKVDTVAVTNYQEEGFFENIFQEHIKPMRLCSKVRFITPTEIKALLSGKTVNLYGYEVLSPPFALDFENWTKDKAEEYKSWFIGNMHERAEYVMKMCRSRSSRQIQLTSPDNLLTVWRWFRRIARTEQIPRKEIEAQRARFGYLGESFVSKKRMTVLTESIIRDIAMLLSVILTENYNNLYWEIVQKPKSDVWYNHPVLKGFINDSLNYPKPFAASFEPVHMVKVQATKYINGRSSDSDLFDLYNLWIKWIPEAMDTQNTSDSTKFTCEQ